MNILKLIPLIYPIIHFVSGNVCLQGSGSNLIASLMTQIGPMYQSYRAKFGRNVSFKFIQIRIGSENTNLQYSEVPRNCQTVFIETDLREFAYDKNIKVFPLISQALVVIYNLQDTTPLNLSLGSIADIYLGLRVQWNDTLIDGILNPTMDLPHEKIIPVAQADYSLTTYLFTHLLSENDDIWATDYGDFYSPNFTNGYCCQSTNFPTAVKYFGQTIQGMVGLVSSIPYAIGYATLPSIAGLNVRQAVLVTGYNYTPTYPTAESIQRTIFYIYNKSDPPSLVLNLSVDDESDSYPLIAINYFAINITMDHVDCEVAEELTGFLHFFLFGIEPQTFINLKHVPLIPPLARQIQKDIIEKITCKGQNMYNRYMESLVKYSTLDSWTIIVICLAVVICLCLVCIVAYIRHMKRKHAILQWMISPEKCQLISLSMMKDLTVRNGSISGDRMDTRSAVISFDQTERIYSKGKLKHVLTFGDLDSKKVFLNAAPVKAPSTWQKKTKKFITKCKNLSHKNIASFLGVTLIHGRTNLIIEYYPKGTLHFVLSTSRYNLTETILFHLAFDVACGLHYLHHNGIVHGHLSSLNCLVDGSWTVHVAQWEEFSLLATEAPTILKQRTIYHEDTIHEEDILIKLIYLDPAFDGRRLLQSADVYSFGVLLYEVFMRQLPFIKCIGGIRRVLYKKFVKKTYPIPEVEDHNIVLPQEFAGLANQCMRIEPDRPLFTAVLTKMTRADMAQHSIVDVMMDTMESYADTLEDKVHERTAELKELNSRMRDLLHEVLPPQIAEKLFNKEPVPPEFFECITIYFSDICGFTTISAQSTPNEVMNLLNQLWTVFDRIIGKMDVYKVDTIGDAYMVCSGLPERNGHYHCRHIADLALTLLNEVMVFKIPHLPNERLMIRIGINSGPVTAGIVGQKMPQYCVFGDTVNTAARMESTGLPLKIQLSENTQKLLVEHFKDEFHIEFRGTIAVKGKGTMSTYWLINDRPVIGPVDKGRSISSEEPMKCEIIQRDCD